MLQMEKSGIIVFICQAKVDCSSIKLLTRFHVTRPLCFHLADRSRILEEKGNETSLQSWKMRLLAQVAKSCQQIVTSCPKLLQVAENCHKLQKVTKSCHKYCSWEQKDFLFWKKPHFTETARMGLQKIPRSGQSVSLVSWVNTTQFS